MFTQHAIIAGGPCKSKRRCTARGEGEGAGEHPMNRDEARALLEEHVKNPALIRHALSVEAAMVHYARLQGEDEHLYSLVGLLHDFDYERFPNPPEHTREGARILRERGVDEEIVSAILSHAEWNLEEYPRDRPVRKTLFAVDELCGFIYAAALVRPERILGMKAKSVRKKMKTPSFAAAVNRDDIVKGAELLGVTLDEHIDNCIAAMTTVATELDLLPPAS
jgi:putative nucleotidyltransferase with HDIG domain